MNKTIVVLYMNLGPYHISRMNALSKIYKNLVVIEAASQYSVHSWTVDRTKLEFRLETLFDKNIETVKESDQKKAIVSRLEKLNPQIVVVSGYRQVIMRAAAKWSTQNEVPCMLLFVSTEFDHKRIWLREYVKRKFFMEDYSGFAVSGERARAYARKLGAPNEKIYLIGNVVDNQKIKSLSDEVNKDKDAKRAEYRLPNEYFLYVGRFSAEKNLMGLIDAYDAYRISGGKWDLVLVGGGPQDNQLKMHANSLVKTGIHFRGWIQFDNLITFYALAKAFVLPSISEPWGLVVNEAMTCKLPVLLSKKCGCLPELLKPGQNGYDFTPYDSNEIAKAMRKISSKDRNLAKMGEASLKIIMNFTPESWAQRLAECISKTAAH